MNGEIEAVISGGRVADEGEHEYLELTNDDALLIVSVNRSYPGLSSYDASRYAWRVSPERAKRVEYVIATKNRRVVGVFRPSAWKPATIGNFPEFNKERPGRIGFVGTPASGAVAARFIGKLLPADFRFSGNGYRYAGKLGT